MKSSRNIDNLIRKFDINSNSAMNEAVLVKLLKAQAEHLKNQNLIKHSSEGHELFPSCFSHLGWICGLVAVFVAIIACLSCYILSGKVTGLRNELAQAQREVAVAQTDDSTTINFYLKEHQEVVARYASVNTAAQQPAQMRVNRYDILYYEMFDNQPEYMRPGIIVRGPSFQRQISQSEAPAISNGHTLTLSEARKTAAFKLKAPPRLYPGFSFDKIRRIEGREALQLLYTDGINSVSLFEQPLDGQSRLSHQDVREYAIYQNKDQAGGTILAFRDDALSYVLIGNIEMSQLMYMARAVIAGK